MEKQKPTRTVTMTVTFDLDRRVPLKDVVKEVKDSVELSTWWSPDAAEHRPARRVRVSRAVEVKADA